VPVRSILPAIVLSAGKSRRMGRTKALLPTDIAGETFITRIVRALRAGGVDDVLVVVGSAGPQITQALASLDPPPRTVVNPRPEEGQLSSLLTGLAAVDRPGVGGLMVTLVDVPLIDAETVRRLRVRHQETGAPFVRPVNNGRHGHPVIFDRAVFDDLRSADRALGAKPVVRAYLDRSVEVPVELEGPFLDVDTPAAYEQVFGRPVPSVSQ